MGAPKTPAILAPRGSEEFVNPFKAIPLRMDEHDDTSTGSSNTVVAIATDTNYIDTAAGGWTSSANFRIAGGLMNAMAVGIEGATQSLDWRQLANYTPAVAAERVTKVEVEGYYASEFNDPPLRAGAATLRIAIYYKNERRYEDDVFLGDKLWTNTPAQGDRFAFDITDVIREILGRQVITVGDMEVGGPVLGPGGAPSLAHDLRVFVIATSHGRHDVTLWHCGSIGLKLYYETGTTPSTVQAAYQFQVDDDSGFGSIEYDSGEAPSAALTHWLNKRDAQTGKPWPLSFDTLYYVQARRKDGAGVWSSYSPSATFRTLKESAARMYSSSLVDPIYAANLGVGFYGDLTEWDLETAGGATKVWSISLHRDRHPSQNFRVSGLFWEDNVRKVYAEVSSVAAVDATASTYWWDEFNEQAHPSGARLYLQPSTSHCPAGFRSMGLRIGLWFHVATHDILSGPGEQYPFLPWILSEPSVTTLIEDRSTGNAATPSGDLELASPGDFWFDTIARTKLIGTGEDFDNVKWIVHGMPIEIFLLGSHRDGAVPYAERVPVFDGIQQWPTGPMLRHGGARIRVTKKGALADEHRLGTQVYTTGQYEHLVSGLEGQTIPELLGETGCKIRCDVVDTSTGATGRLIRPCLTMTTIDGGLSVDAISFGTQATGPSGGAPWWLFDATSNHIQILSGGFVDFDNETGGDWRVFGSPLIGDRLTNAESGNMAQYMLEKSGTPTSEIETATFDEFTADVGIFIEAETSAADIIRQCGDVGRFHVVPKPNGIFEAIPDVPDGVWSSTSIVQLGDLIEPRPVEIEIDFSGLAMSHTIQVRAGSTAKWEEASRDVTTFFFSTLGQFGISKSLPPYEWSGNTSGDAVNSLPPASTPRKQTTLTLTSQSAGLSYAGSALLINFPDDIVDPGSDFRWAVWQVRRHEILSSERVRVTIRWILDLPLLEQPT